MPSSKGKKLLTFPHDIVADNSVVGEALSLSPKDDPEAKPVLPTWKELALQAQKILCKLSDPCPVCHEPMIPVSWSGERISIVCGNYGCNKFRQPARYVRKSDVRDLIAQINSLEMAEATQMLNFK